MKPRTLWTSSWLSVCAVYAAIGMPQPTRAADQVVTNNNDAGAGSLRQAVTDVHDGGKITFDGDYVITLASNLPRIAKAVTIVGRGCKQTVIDGAGSYQPFYIRDGASLTMSHLTVRNAVTISNCGVLNLEGVDLHGNTGYSGAVTQLSSGTSATIIDSAIYGNTASNRGGAIHATVGTVTIKNTTISGNVSEYYGAGVCVEGADVILDSCTIANNSFSGNYGSAKGGGVMMLDGSLTIQNTIVANNQQAGGDNDYYYMSGTLTDNGYNFVEVSNTSDATGFADGVNNNIVGTDPVGLAGSLAYEGGWTPVLKVTAGTLTGGNYGSTSETRDQRGHHRKTGEITRGAYQYGGIVAIRNFNSWDNGYDSIAGAVAAADDGDTIYLIDAVIKAVGVNVNSADKSYVIAGQGTENTCVWGADDADAATGGIFRVTNSNVELKDMTIQHGNAASHGGAAYLDSGSLTLTNCVVADNIGGEAAGGVFNKVNSELTITNCRFRNNICNPSYDGGAVLAKGTVSITGSTFTGNKSRRGGGVYIYAGANSVVERCTFIDNEAGDGAGGGLYHAGDTLTLNRCTFDGNMSVSNAGGVFNGAGSTLKINNCYFLNNDSGATHLGGGVYNVNVLSVANSTFLGNAAYVGGGLAGEGGETTINNCTFTQNSALGAAGAVAALYGAMTIANCTIAGNSGSDFGGGVAGIDAQTGVLNSIIINNSADADEDLYADGGVLKIQNSWYADAAGATAPATASNVTDAYTAGDLLSLAYAGGFTPTMPLSADAPACGAGDFVYYNSTDGYYCQDSNGDYLDAFGAQVTPADPASDKIADDQRGVARVAPVSIGAYYTSYPRPTVTTAAVTNVTADGAQSGGYVADEGDASVTARGVCWSFDPNPTLDDDYTVDDSGAGAFTSTITGLRPNEKYYLRAYASNIFGTSYGGQLEFTTDSTNPSVITAQVTDVTATTAVSGGEITSTGGLQVAGYGVCWNTAPNPTVDNDKTQDLHHDFDSGHPAPLRPNYKNFISNITGLSPATTYYVRAYALNAVGVGYGDQIEFTTSPGAPTVTTAPVTDLAGDSARCGGEVVSDGGRGVTARGVCWNTSGAPTISDDKTADGDGSGAFTSDITGLEPDTVYYVRAYAINKIDVAYGAERTFSTAVPDDPNSGASGPDLRVTVQTDEQSSSVGQEIDFEIKVENVGNASATGVILRFPLPPGTELVGAWLLGDQAAQNAPLDVVVEGDEIVITLGDVTVSQSLKLNLVLKATTSGAVTLTASATCTEKVTPAVAQSTLNVNVEDIYVEIVRSLPQAQTCGLLGFAPFALTFLGLLAMKPRARR